MCCFLFSSIITMEQVHVNFSQCHTHSHTRIHKRPKKSTIFSLFCLFSLSLYPFCVLLVGFMNLSCSSIASIASRLIYFVRLCRRHAQPNERSGNIASLMVAAHRTHFPRSCVCECVPATKNQAWPWPWQAFFHTNTMTHDRDCKWEMKKKPSASIVDIRYTIRLHKYYTTYA